MKANQTEQRVYYADTDRAGVVYYAAYLRWFEIGRTELLRDLGFDYADFEKQGLIVPVAEVYCSYRSPAQYNDVVVIKTSVGKIGTSSIRFDYTLANKKSNKLLAEGHTVNVFVDVRTKKSTKIPDELIKVLG